MTQTIVLDAAGHRLSSTTEEKAHQLLAEGKARLICQEPLTIQLPYVVELPPKPEGGPVGQGQRLLLHICCAPCSTYTLRRLREEGFDVTGLWYNHNIHPWTEHQKRADSLVRYASLVNLNVIWEEGYDMPRFLRAVVGHEEFRQRCRICYEMRLVRLARVARQQGFDAITTTLLISPYQDQATLHQLGNEIASTHNLQFYFENFRRGWAERNRLTREYGLYRQQYCGCLYSEWERFCLDKTETESEEK